MVARDWGAWGDRGLFFSPQQLTSDLGNFEEQQFKIFCLHLSRLKGNN